jgi:hypothetical protein
LTHAVLVALVLPTAAVAQGKPVVEIGTNLGLTIEKAHGETLTVFGVPGQGLLGQPTMYASFFAGRKMLVEPQLALRMVHVDGETFTTLGLGGQLAYLTRGSAVNSPFLAGTLGFQSSSGGSGGSDSDFGLGAKIGYRTILGSSVGLRFEAGYRRWFDSELNEITIGIGIGGIIHGSR